MLNFEGNDPWHLIEGGKLHNFHYYFFHCWIFFYFLETCFSARLALKFGSVALYTNEAMHHNWQTYGVHLGCFQIASRRIMLWTEWHNTSYHLWTILHVPAAYSQTYGSVKIATDLVSDVWLWHPPTGRLWEKPFSNLCLIPPSVKRWEEVLPSWVPAQITVQPHGGTRPRMKPNGRRRRLCIILPIQLYVIFKSIPFDWCSLSEELISKLFVP